MNLPRMNAPFPSYSDTPISGNTSCDSAHILELNNPLILIENFQKFFFEETEKRSHLDPD
jgi:hypothetical protein